MLNLRRLQIFCEVVDAGSLGLVAERQHITQPVVSRMLAAVEEHFGTQLLERRGRRLGVTEAGWVVYRLGKDVLRAEREARRQVDGLVRGDAGLISVAMTDSIGNYVMPGLWARFHAQHAKANLSLRIRDSEAVMELVAEGSVDLGIAAAERIPRGVVAEKLGDRCMILVAAPGHRLAGRGPVCATDLVDEHFLCSTGAYHRSTTDTRLRLAGLVGPYRLILFGDAEAVKRAVQEDLGLAFLSGSTIRDDLASGRLCRLDLQGPVVSSPIVVARCGDKPLRPLQAKLWDFLRAHAAEIVA